MSVRLLLPAPPRWSSSGARPATKWFGKVPEFDEEIRRRFLPTYEAAAAGKLAAWEQTAQGALALLILLDQFPRNMFRGQARAFATDPQAMAITAQSLIHGFDAQVPPELRAFFYVPFEHSENPADQEHGIALYRPPATPTASNGRTARRYHPPLRPLPTPQSRARPRDHAGGAGLSRRRRVCGVNRMADFHGVFPISFRRSMRRAASRPMCWARSPTI